jgi:Arc/MetJ-type ribon-helix-helix transcriptional regulator
MDMRSVAIPEQLYRAAEERFGRRFGSVDELVSELLKELVRDDGVRLDQKEQEIIEERLKGLGYI